MEDYTAGGHEQRLHAGVVERMQGDVQQWTEQRRGDGREEERRGVSVQ
jgi:hypothetical protein